MILRRINPHEFDSTVVLFRYYYGEAEESIPSMVDDYDENSVIDTIRLFSSNVNYCWYNMYDNNRPVGFVAAMASEYLWNKSIIDAHIAFIYLLPSHRNMDNFRAMMQEIEGWGRMIGARRITGGDIGINPERTRKLYEHFGFKSGVWLGKEISE